MKKYTITTDAASMEIEAENMDEAANKFSPRGCETMLALEEEVVAAGGWLTVEEDGEVVLRILPE